MLAKLPAGSAGSPGTCPFGRGGSRGRQQVGNVGSALAGIVFVVLTLVAGFLPGARRSRATRPPRSPSSSPTRTTSSAGPGSSARSRRSSCWWFLGAVWRILRRAEGGSPRLTVVRRARCRVRGRAGSRRRHHDQRRRHRRRAGHRRQSGTRFFYLLFDDLAVPRVHRPGAVRGCVLDRDHPDRRAPESAWAGSARCIALVAARRRWRSIASTRDVFFNLSFVGVRRLLALGADRQRDDVPVRGSRRRGTGGFSVVTRWAARVPRAGNASGRVPSASLTAFHVAAATAANTASDARGTRRRRDRRRSRRRSVACPWRAGCRTTGW